MKAWKHFLLGPLLLGLLWSSLAPEAEAGIFRRRSRTTVTTTNSTSNCPGGVCPAQSTNRTVIRQSTPRFGAQPATTVIQSNACPGGVCPPRTVIQSSGGAGTVIIQTSGLGDTGDQVVTLVNQQRARHGLRPVSRGQLGAVAHSQAQASRHSMYHASGWIENVGSGQSTPEQIVSDWMNSPGHRANILNPSATVADAGGVGGYWTLRLR